MSDIDNDMILINDEYKEINDKLNKILLHITVLHDEIHNINEKLNKMDNEITILHGSFASFNERSANLVLRNYISDKSSIMPFVPSNTSGLKSLMK
jgi:predicted  nucleic acid-binding Zn-ribbon protein